MTRRSGDANPFSAMMREAFRAMMRQSFFSLPGKVLTFNAREQLAQVQCGVQLIDDGQPVTITPIDNVPVIFPGDGSYHLWHQVGEGTEGLIHFSQRAIDDWLEQGGPAAPTDKRMLSVEDAFFVPGARSKPGAISSFTNDGIGIGSNDGTQYVHVASDGSIQATDSVSTVTMDGAGTVTVTNGTGTYTLTATGAFLANGLQVDASGIINATAYSVGGTPGVTGSFTTSDGTSVTVTNGIVTGIS